VVDIASRAGMSLRWEYNGLFLVRRIGYHSVCN
jgi:hypothetical protein